MEPISEQPRQSAYKKLEETGHAFRGRFIDKCALVEEWAIQILQDAGEKPKSNYLFGQKLSAIKKLAEASPSKFKAPPKILELLDRFQPFAEIRSALAHAKQSVATTENRGLILFQPVSSSSYEVRWRQIVLTPDECTQMIGEVSSLANQFSQQGLVKRPS